MIAKERIKTLNDRNIVDRSYVYLLDAERPEG